MNQKYSEVLLRTFPDIFDRKLLAGGIGCQDGWFDLLCEFAIAVRRLQKAAPAGDFRVCAISTESGVLRIRHRQEPLLASLVRQYEERSKTLCELDGSRAAGLFALRPHWQRYLCRQCAEFHELMMVEETMIKEWPEEQDTLRSIEGSCVLAFSAAA